MRYRDTRPGRKGEGGVCQHVTRGHQTLLVVTAQRYKRLQSAKYVMGTCVQLITDPVYNKPESVFIQRLVIHDP